MRKIYLASSWRNEVQPQMVVWLREQGHEVYDFRNPPGGIENGFRWSEIDGDWRTWSATQYRQALEHPLAIQGFNSDFEGMRWCDTCVLLLPCGRSAHLEAGWCIGAGKDVVVLTRDGEEPELMAKLANRICVVPSELFAYLRQP